MARIFFQRAAGISSLPQEKLRFALPNLLAKIELRLDCGCVEFAAERAALSCACLGPNFTFGVMMIKLTIIGREYS